jgi:hypothetical protein
MTANFLLILFPRLQIIMSPSDQSLGGITIMKKDILQAKQLIFIHLSTLTALSLGLTEFEVFDRVVQS